MRKVLPALLVLLPLFCAGCVTVSSSDEGEGEAAYVPEAESADESAMAEDETGEAEDRTEVAATEDETEVEPEVPLAVAELERHEPKAPTIELAEAVVTGGRRELIHNLVAEAQTLLREVKLEYAFTGKGKKETLRGRPVAFALWSEKTMEWTVAHVEIPRPPVKWKPGRKPLPFLVTTPGIEARHVKGTGAERLMFAFTKNGETLKVYGRKFPVFDSDLLKKKRWRDVVDTAQSIVYLPFTEDTFDPQFVTAGKDFLLATARRAIEELRAAHAPSQAYPGQLLADVVPAEVITTLAVIEQTDDADFVEKGEEAFNEVLNQYGLKQGEAYRYSVSSASAIGPMQFTNKRGNGTYALVVRRCPEAKLDRDFERGATNLLNAMKAAICLFDIELNQMAKEIRAAYYENNHVLGIFPVAAYNGGPKNVKKLHKVVQKMKLKLEDLRPPGEEPDDSKVKCPCLWKGAGEDVLPVSIPRYNNENRWYIEKYQRILSIFEEQMASGEGLLPSGNGRQQRAVDSGLHLAGQNGS
jgi:hypothetical protein